MLCIPTLHGTTLMRHRAENKAVPATRVHLKSWVNKTSLGNLLLYNRPASVE